MSIETVAMTIVAMLRSSEPIVRVRCRYRSLATSEGLPSARL
nr:hypothetical protein [Janibacter limosus]